MSDLSRHVPPQNIEAEQGVIGSCLFDNAAINDVADVVSPEDFYRDAHQIIFRAILDLWNAGSKVDALILADELTRRDELKRVGAEDYLAEILNSVPHAAHVLTYAQITRQCSVKRQLIDMAIGILNEGYKNQCTAEELLATAEKGILDVSAATARDGAVPLHVAAAESMHEMAGRLSGLNPGIKTGLADLDDMLYRLKPKKLYILAARPSIGKSCLALNIAEFVANQNRGPVLFVSLEMDRVELASRFLIAQAEVDGYAFEHPKRLTDAERERLRIAVDVAAKSKLLIDDPPRLTITQLCARARRHKIRGGLAMLVVDYLQLIDGQPRKGEIREQEVARVSRGLKSLAKELAIPVFAVAQLNRATENREGRKPSMADLRESGQIEADADAVMLMHRPDFYDPTDQPGKSFVIIPKHRGGRTGTVELAFIKEQQRFTDVDVDIPPVGGKAPF